jgi:hypothetical protein
MRGSGKREGARTCAWAELIVRTAMTAAAQKRTIMMAFID